MGIVVWEKWKLQWDPMSSLLCLMRSFCFSNPFPIAFRRLACYLQKGTVEVCSVIETALERNIQHGHVRIGDQDQRMADPLNLQIIPWADAVHPLELRGKVCLAHIDRGSYLFQCQRLVIMVNHKLAYRLKPSVKAHCGIA